MLLLAGLLLCARTGHAQPALDAGPDAAAAALDPLLPTGAERLSEPRPRDIAQSACSLAGDVCVHAARGVPDTLTLAVLRALQSAYERLVHGLALPEPRSDRDAGGSDALDLYLDATVAGGESSLRVIAESAALAPFDVAPAFCALSADPREPAAALARAAHLCVAEASLLALDASETPNLRRAIARELWLALGTPTYHDFAELDDAQARPERALAARELGQASAAGSLLFEYLERERGGARPGTLPVALLAMGAGKTPPERLHWNNEPDLFDVLRGTFGGDRAEYAAVLADFSVSRAFLGSRDDGRHFPSLAWIGDFGRVRFDWSIPASSLPRRVAVTRPIEPTGAVYVWVELDKLPLGAVLGFQASWEAPSPYKWSLVRVDKDGSELSRIDVPFQERATSIEARATNLEAASALLIVGTHIGGVDLGHPFDPDFAPFEAQSCTIYLAAL